MASYKPVAKLHDKMADGDHGEMHHDDGHSHDEGHGHDGGHHDNDHGH